MSAHEEVIEDEGEKDIRAAVEALGGGEQMEREARWLAQGLAIAALDESIARESSKESGQKEENEQSRRLDDEGGLGEIEKEGQNSKTGGETRNEGKRDALMDSFEARIWPKYEGDALALSQAAWLAARQPQEEQEGSAPAQPAQSPEWFNELVLAQAKALLKNCFSANTEWVVFPEAISKWALVVKMKRGEASSPVASASDGRPMALRYHSIDQFSELARLSQKALGVVIKQWMKQEKTEYIELENEDLALLLFSKSKLNQTLLELGFPEEKLPEIHSMEAMEKAFEELGNR